MNTKLTLRMDDTIITKIKDFASCHNISISKLTESMFKNILELEDSINNDLSPIAQKYKGILTNTKDSFDDLKYKHLKAKYE